MQADRGAGGEHRADGQVGLALYIRIDWFAVLDMDGGSYGFSGEAALLENESRIVLANGTAAEVLVFDLAA